MEIIRRKTDYSLRALLAILQAGRPLRVEELAEREEAPAPFLYKALADLAEAGILEGQRGPRGGYTLARPAGGISVLEVVEALQGPLRMSECLGGKRTCTREETCVQRVAWQKAQQGLVATLGGITLEHLAAQCAPTGPGRKTKSR
jgi:Rrf2 family iron-sulfur cluster assembly transcriptional regulator